jgi:hypothetical protein
MEFDSFFPGKMTKLDSHFIMVMPHPKLADLRTGLWYPKPSWVIIILGHPRFLNPKHCMVGGW